MNQVLHLARKLAMREDSGAQIVEFAVALPLLVVFVVGIFDFSNAFTLKQRLTNIARSAARVAAADPSNDLTGGTAGANPISVADVYYLVDNSLIADHLNDCGLASSGTLTSSGLTWTFTATGNGCPSPGLKIIVNRGYFYPVNGGATPSTDCVSPGVGGQTQLISTCVSIQYAYAWRFGQAASLLGRSMTLPPQITATAVALNEN
ncbi:MAG TPA: TadE family protein [Dongiaceae bacterium]|nr:TadE family protein [Dongiaceae bacterium]